jgi:hypothetical protein
MKTWVELLATTLGTDPTDKQKRYLAKVHEEIRRLTSLLDELSSGPSS